MARRGLKVKVIGQGQGHGLSYCGRSDLDPEQFVFLLFLVDRNV